MYELFSTWIKNEDLKSYDAACITPDGVKSEF
jgi:hypothetical protein